MRLQVLALGAWGAVGAAVGGTGYGCLGGGRGWMAEKVLVGRELLALPRYCRRQLMCWLRWPLLCSPGSDCPLCGFSSFPGRA